MSTEVIARRELEFVTSSNRETVIVELLKPVKEKDGPWLCHYLIEGESFRKEFRTAGEDSMQALILVFKIIPWSWMYWPRSTMVILLGSKVLILALYFILNWPNKPLALRAGLSAAF